MSTVTRWILTLRTRSINDSWVTHFQNRRLDPVAGVDRHSSVFASVTEISAPPNGPLDFAFLGDAMISVWNIAPTDSGDVFFVLRVVPEFFDLDVRISFLVCND